MAQDELVAMAKVVAAARCIRHWHDGYLGKDEYFSVSGEAVRDLWQALADYDKFSKVKPVSSIEGEVKR
jgi:hypothetical protein